MSEDLRNFRISVYLNHFFHDHRSICRIFVNGKIKTISDLMVHIGNIFKIHNFNLVSQNHYLPTAEDVRILQRDDVVIAVPHTIPLDEQITTDFIQQNYVDVQPTRIKKKRSRSIVEISREIEECDTHKKREKKKKKKDKGNDELYEPKMKKKKSYVFTPTLISTPIDNYRESTYSNTTSIRAPCIKDNLVNSDKVNSKLAAKRINIEGFKYKAEKDTDCGDRNDNMDSLETDLNEKSKTTNKKKSRNSSKTKLLPEKFNESTPRFNIVQTEIIKPSNLLSNSKIVNDIQLRETTCDPHFIQHNSGCNNFDMPHEDKSVPMTPTTCDNVLLKTPILNSLKDDIYSTNITLMNCNNPHTQDIKNATTNNDSITNLVSNNVINGSPVVTDVKNDFNTHNNNDTNSTPTEHVMSMKSYNSITIKNDVVSTKVVYSSQVDFDNLIVLQDTNNSCAVTLKDDFHNGNCSKSPSNMECPIITTSENIADDAALQELMKDEIPMLDSQKMFINNISLNSASSLDMAKNLENNSNCLVMDTPPGVSSDASKSGFLVMETPPSVSSDASFSFPKIRPSMTKFGIGAVIESLKGQDSSSTSLDLESDSGVTKRKRHRVRKRKTKGPPEEPIKIETPVFKPPKVQGKPLVHIKFHEDATIEMENDITINNSIINIDSSSDINESMNKSCKVTPSETLENDCVVLNDSMDCKDDITDAAGSHENDFVCTTLSEEAISKCPLMNQLIPKANDIIIFKKWKMGENYTPEISAYITAKVVKYNHSDENLVILILGGSEEFVEHAGKFSMDDDEMYSVDDNLKQINWADVIGPRLLFP